MKTLIIGAAGFVGQYLLSHLQEDCGWEVCVTKLPQETLDCSCQVRDLNILDPEAIFSLLQEVQPDAIVHLAAQSSVALSWKRPQLTAEVNVCGALNLLEAVRRLEVAPRLLLVGSGDEYGALPQGICRVTEEQPPHPTNIYAVTKLCQNLFGSLYANAYQMDVICVRAFNHIGPGQLPGFVVSDFCKQIAEIELGLRQPVLMTGNLDAKRDFTDVRDVVRAYGMLLQSGRSGETYNVGSGHAVAISELLQQLCGLASVPISHTLDPERLRPSDLPVIEADISKLQRDTGWSRMIPLEQTLLDTLNDWRRRCCVQN